MLKVFYRPEQSCPEAQGYSPSAGKPAQVVADWLDHPLIAPKIEIESFEPASREILYAAHSKRYVDDVLDGQTENGFGNTSKAVADSLLYTTGSMLAAAKWVTQNKSLDRYYPNFACSPTSGFHHAGYNYGGGFCTFNGLMATAIEVHRLGLADKILILDFDQHYGNGTESIIRKLGLDYITHITAQQDYETAADISDIIRSLTSDEYKDYGLVLFQAGADIHVADPLGGRLTTKQMHQRDFGVLHGCRMRNLPVVWNLAGGYQTDLKGSLTPVLRLHRQTMLAALSARPE